MDVHQHCQSTPLTQPVLYFSDAVLYFRPVRCLALPKCPVRALRYYHRYLFEHPELRKGRRSLFIPNKDNNARKDLSAATISRWICKTIVISHAAFENSKSVSVKAHEVRAVANSSIR